ncbi:MAG: hypothetical protein GX575_11050 [Candidatus Anammoximicrobium sp.]|nr:hypothetical protein [Candidatus Anammoximicrobium sp.]
MRTAEGDARTPLQLNAVPHPARGGAAVQLFADWQTACAHLRDHWLTAPECQAWALVAPAYTSLLDPGDADARYRYAEQARITAGSSAQPLYDLCVAAVALEAGDAARLQWVQDDGRVTAAMGTSGVVLLIEGVVRTAFVAGQGDPQATKDGQRRRLERRGLPRERPLRSGGHGGDPHGPQSRRPWEDKWSAEERLYYRVFRPAVQLVKRAQHRSRDMRGGIVRADYALLKGLLPTRSRLKYEDWLELRRACRPESPSGPPQDPRPAAVTDGTGKN